VTNRRRVVADGPPVGADEWVVRASRGFLPGTGFVSDCVVHVRGSTIVWVGDRAAAAARPELSGIETVTFDRATLTPGLIDSHTHLTFSGDHAVRDQVRSESDLDQLTRAVGNAQHALAHGVTTLVDCGARGLTTHALRDAFAAGLLAGPRLLAAGPPITTTAGHCHWLGGHADSHDDVIRAARLRVTEGSDIVKLMLTGGNMTAGSNPSALQYSPATVSAAASDAARLGKPLVVHAHSVDGVAVAARAGARVIAHATCVDAAGRAPAAATLDLLAASGAFVDPTLMVGHGDGPTGEGEDSSSAALSRAEIREAMLPVFREMHARGVPLLAGTDGGSTGVAHHRVAGSVRALHEEVGLSLEQALLGATDLPARAFGVRDVVGAIEPGLSADLAVFDGDVSRSVEALERPVAVWARGNRVALPGEVGGGRSCCTTSSI
jgi:imidazolonepropionase-like amidohydrolase